VSPASAGEDEQVAKRDQRLVADDGVQPTRSAELRPRSLLPSAMNAGGNGAKPTLDSPLSLVTNRRCP
jgi:hypothetical protein